ncbi:hypothetical protein [Microbacterium sp. H6]|uniref:hypothetical protein n=1 Tax=Microbacterium sp. H6 TaxID=421122 RepID=UPI000DE3C30A|nr:hypothetical protein [Microbacterium sp. H6]RBO72776.1 hypothetical protein DSP71_09065 [Microbacterium sp. H6]
MNTPDNFPALRVALLFAAILILWIAFDLRERKRIARESAAGAVFVAEQAVSMASSGECARAWVTSQRAGHRVHLCARPYEHMGPCDCGVCPDGLDR